MKSFSLFFLMLFVFIVAQAQTKIISHKSHGGKVSDFRTNYAFTIGESWFSNFGAAPQKIIKIAQLDSVVYINDSTTVMFTSLKCHDEYDESDYPSIWKAGKDTLLNHPVFSDNIEVDSMKNIIEKQYYFKNKIKDVIFIDFDKRKTNQNIQQDNNQQDNNQQNYLPPIFNKKSPNDFLYQKIFMLIGALLVALTVGLIASKLKKIN